jgi:predicted nucleotidyltransferase/DNA-binding XRE family transcriptional regulator
MSAHSVASLLRSARQGASQTQRELALRAGTSQPAVAAYESGSKTPTIPTLERLLSVCEHDLVIDSRRAQPPPTVGALRRRRRKLLDAAAAHGVANVRIFGSVARAQAGASSDVDLLVDLEPGRTLVDLAAFREDVRAIVGTPIDVATSDVLKRTVRAEALREAVPL